MSKGKLKAVATGAAGQEGGAISLAGTAEPPPKWLADLAAESGDFVSPAKQNDPDAAFEAGIACVQLAGIRFALGGYWFERAKAAAGGGTRWVGAKADEKNVSKESVYAAMRYFNFLDEIGEEDAIRQIASLGYTVVDEQLRKLGAEGVRRLTHGEEVSGLTWDKVCSASRNDLRQHMRQLQGEREEVIKAEKRAERAAQRADELQAEVRSLREQEMHLADLPRSVRYARVEGAAFGLVADEGLIRLRELLNNVYQGVDLHAEPRARQMEMELGVKAVATVCRGIIGQASEVLRHIESKTPDFLTEEELDYPVLADAEARAVHERFRKMVATAWFSLDTAVANLPGKKERRRAS